jgi:hypothetical protein
MGKVYVITESISIQTFRQKIRTLLKVVTESVGVVHDFFLKLQYGLVTQGQTQSNYWTSNSESCADSSNSTGTGISSESESCGDTSQTISSGDTQESVEGGN